MTGAIALRQRSSTARGRDNNGQNRPADAELQRIKDELRCAGLLPARPRLLIRGRQMTGMGHEQPSARLKPKVRNGSNAAAP
jgi:hypothetical protein